MDDFLDTRVTDWVFSGGGHAEVARKGNVRLIFDRM